MKKSKKLTLEERVQIKTHLEHFIAPSQITKRLVRARSTITRELNNWGYKNKVFWLRAYNPELAHFFSLKST